eukprot:12978379-Heterocapsa_arctica.AAC.1
MSSGGFGLGAGGSVVTASVQDLIPTGSAYLFSGGELASKSDAHAGNPFLWRHGSSLGGVQGGDPLMVLVFIVTKVPESVYVVVIIGGSPSGLELDNFVFL